MLRSKLIRAKQVSRCLITAISVGLLTAACSSSPGGADIPTETIAETRSVLGSSENPVQFRTRFIKSHEILEGCKGYPYIAKTTAGGLAYSSSGTLGRSAADWKQISSGETLSMDNKEIKIEVINTIPIMSSVKGQTSINCALIIDPSQAREFAYRILDEANMNSLFVSTLMSVVNKQIQINQPVKLSWSHTTQTNTDGNITTRVDSMNAEPGKLAVSGSYTIAEGRYIIDPRCQDIFNPTPESSCSSPLEIDSSKLILE